MQMLKKPVSILLSLMLIISLFTIVPITANAEGGIEYNFRSWDNNNKTVKTETRTRTNYIDLSTYTTNDNYLLEEG